MIRRMEFDTEIEMRLPAPKKFRGLVGISYKGNNMYRVRAMEIKTKKMMFDKEIEFPTLKGNSRKNFSRVRDMALNAVESRPLNYARTEG